MIEKKIDFLTRYSQENDFDFFFLKKNRHMPCLDRSFPRVI